MDCADDWLDMEFGFNDVKFSNRTLHLQLIPDLVPHLEKRRRLNNGHEAAENNGNSSHTDCSTIDNKTIHINTLILAAKSPYFRKLFSNGMTESNQDHTTLQIQESEEPAVMQLLKFMYATTLSNTTPSALVDVLIAADKYEVASCMKYCLQQLQNLPMTCELALSYLDIPSTILMSGIVQSLKDAGKEFLIACFKDVRKFEKKILTLPLVGIEAVLSSDDLRVISEDEIYDFVMKWAREYYTEPDKRREMLHARLLHLIRFPCMSPSKLKEVLTCPDIYLELRSKLVVDALSFKTPRRQRAYKRPPVRVIQFELSHEECDVYLDLKREDCIRPSSISSQPFDFGGHEFSLRVSSINQRFTLGLIARKKGLVGFAVEVEFSARARPSEVFISMGNLNVSLSAKRLEYGCTGLYEVPWDTFIAENSAYFINGIIHLKAVLKIKKEA